MLNIWGVMLFIRMTWIVGQAGIGRFDFGRPCELALQFTSTLSCFHQAAVISHAHAECGGEALRVVSCHLAPSALDMYCIQCEASHRRLVFSAEPDYHESWRRSPPFYFHSVFLHHCYHGHCCDYHHGLLDLSDRHQWLCTRR